MYSCLSINMLVSLAWYMYIWHDMNKTDLTFYAVHLSGLNQVNRGDFSPYGHWVLLRFIQAFGMEVCSIPLQQLAIKIGVQHKKLRRVLEELQQENLLTVSYPEQGHRAKVRHIKLSDERFGYLRFNEPKATEHHKRAIDLLKQRLALYPMIERLLNAIETISIDAEVKESELDFNSALLLLTLLRHGNRFGIVMGCGNVEIYKKTGLKKQSMYKYLYKLINLGFIRSRAEGSIRNAFISLEDPIYSLNLSHSLWGEVALYGRFYIIEYPEKHQFEVKRLALAKHRVTGKIKKEDLDVEKQNFLYDPISYLYQSKVETQESFIQYQRAEYALLFKALEALNDQDVDYLKFIRFDQLGTRELQTKTYSYNKGDGLLQCYLEQHCCEVYSHDISLYRQLLQSVAVRLHRQGKDALFSNKKYYQEDHLKFIYENKFSLIEKNESFLFKEINSITAEERLSLAAENNSLFKQALKDKIKIENQIGIREASFHIVLGGMLDLIAFNQISLFLKIFKEFVPQEKSTHMIFKKLARMPEFRILPRTMDQTRYSCFFVPDRLLKEDQYFFGDVSVRFEHPSSQEKLQFLSLVSQQVMPSDEELVEYGIVSYISNDKSKGTSC